MMAASASHSGQPTGVAVVTGAGRGIGRAIAIALAEVGYDLVLGWNSDEAAVEQTLKMVAGQGVLACAVRGDIADEATSTALALAALELGGLDVWVNNAGVSVFSSLLETTAAQARTQMEVNFLGTFHGCVSAGKTMSSRGGGRIINIASDLGVLAAPLLAAYSASKFAVVGLTQAAAVELAPAKINVNALCPGTVETDMVLAEEESEARVRGVTVEQVRARLLGGVPAGRLCRESDVANMVTFLSSPAASYLTGQAICVNGGSILH